MMYRVYFIINNMIAVVVTTWNEFRYITVTLELHFI